MSKYIHRTKAIPAAIKSSVVLLASRAVVVEVDVKGIVRCFKPPFLYSQNLRATAPRYSGHTGYFSRYFSAITCCKSM